mgnify:CR=1 FL=1
MSDDTIRVAELFAGVGGFRLGLEGHPDSKVDTGFKVVFSNQWEPGETKQWASIIIGAAWAVGTLLSVIRTSGGQSIQGSKILLASLVLCIAFIVPLSSEGVDARTASSVTLRSAQRAALHYSVGLFIIGISVSCRN